VQFPKNNDNPLYLSAERYEATSPQRIRRMLGSLDYSVGPLYFFDVGCGKGRVLLIASEYPFRRIIGIDFSPELVKIAVDNVARYESKHQCNTSIEVVCMDAAKYEFPDENAVIFLANPFNDEVLVKVLENIRQSAQKTKIRYIIYHYPVWEALLDNSEHFSLVLKKRMYSIYKMIN